MIINIRKVMFYLYSLLFILLPLVMYHKTSEIFEFNKILVLYFLTGTIAMVWLYEIVATKKIIIKNNLFTIPLLLFYCTQVLSTLFSIDMHTSIFGYYGRFNGGLLSITAYLVLFFGFITHFDGEDRLATIKKFLLLALGTSAITVLWGLPGRFGNDLSCLLLTGQGGNDCWTSSFQPAIRMFSTLGQPNWFGAYLATLFFIGGYFSIIARKRSHQLLAFSYLVLNFVGILFSRSRSAMLALAVGVTMSLVYLFVTKSKLEGKKSFLKTIALFLLVCMAIVMVFKTGIPKVDKLITLSKSVQDARKAKTQNPSAVKAVIPGEVISESYDIRKVVWQGAYLVGMKHPLFGTGVETFGYAYYFTRLKQHNMLSEWDYVYNKAHNEYLNYFATTGVPGVLAYGIIIGMWYVYLYRAFKYKKLSYDTQTLIMMMTAGFTAILVTNYFGFSVTNINLLFYLLLAMLVLIIENPEKSEMPETYEFDFKTGFASLVGFAIISVFVISYFLADTSYALGEYYRQDKSDYESAQSYYYKAFGLKKEPLYAEKISINLAYLGYLLHFSKEGGTTAKCADLDDTTHDCFALSQKYMKYALDHSSKNVNFYRTQANNYFYQYQATRDEKVYDLAVESLDDAQKMAPTDPRIPYMKALLQLGRLELQPKPSSQDKQELKETAIPHIDKAISLKNNYREAYLLKAFILKAVGDKEGARTVFKAILSKFDPNDEQILDEINAL